jgi:deoxyribodipyrimidine photo-lyase
MTKTIIVWFRNDLRVHDHPALAAAARAGTILPVFILNEDLLHGSHSSPNRNRFLLESLADLQSSLQNLGSDLFILSGDPATTLKELAQKTGASAVYYSSDFTPYSVKRDDIVTTTLTAASIQAQAFAGRLIADSFEQLHTQAGTTHKVFTPFYKNWLKLSRRDLAVLPPVLTPPPALESISLTQLMGQLKQAELSSSVMAGGETAARARLDTFLAGPIFEYDQANNDMAADATSRLSPYLHFGCLSPLEIEGMLGSGPGPEAWLRQLCWREFYNYILYKFPDNAKLEFQPRYRSLAWDTDETLLRAWTTGHTGYPVVDAAMRQLLEEGWMHNRARLIVGSFLTKDLWLDWRLGEAHFMRWLLDGDEPNNNGNWQWIASVGVDPAPVYRRLYNPTSQQKNYDPSGAYVRRYVPELANVPDSYLSQPWTMPEAVQQASGCVIGEQYPAPIVDHLLARAATLERYRTAGELT